MMRHGRGCITSVAKDVSAVSTDPSQADAFLNQGCFANLLTLRLKLARKPYIMWSLALKNPDT